VEKRNSETLEFYNRFQDKKNAFARVGWGSHERQLERFATFLRYAELSRDVECLDFGCGNSALVSYLDEVGCCYRGYVGVELNENLASEAKKNLTSQKQRVFVGDFFEDSLRVDIQLSANTLRVGALIGTFNFLPRNNLQLIADFYQLCTRFELTRLIGFFKSIDSPIFYPEFNYFNPIDFFDGHFRKEFNISLHTGFSDHEFVIVVRPKVP